MKRIRSSRQHPFETPLLLSGPLRSPRQMLAGQEYGGHASLHDDSMARQFGFQAGAIEGPTHFSQFVPLLYELWGEAWFELGCLSVHFRSPCFEGDEVRAFAELPTAAADRVRVRMEKSDGSEVLVGTASVGPVHPPSELEQRLERLRPPEKSVILDQIEVGMKGAERELVRMGFDQELGPLYPFTLAQKLEVITEPSPWYEPESGRDSPWGRPVLPLEMACVLAQYTSGSAGFPVRQPSMGLFADLEVRLLRGPLFVDEEYELEREVVALSGSRRTESYWVRTDIREREGGEVVASTLLNHAVLKDSYPGYGEAMRGSPTAAGPEPSPEGERAADSGRDPDR